MDCIRTAIAIACMPCALLAGPSTAATTITMSVGPDETLTYPSNVPSLPDEHSTIIPPAAGLSAYLLFGASRLSGGNSGTVALQTTDLSTFTPVAEYPAQVMSSSLPLRSCSTTDNSAFDENYAAAGSVVQDPTLPAGNLIMIYEAENHCPGGISQYPYYATVGFMRSPDNGRTWPAPVTGALGTASRYPVLKSADPQSSTPNGTAVGNAIPSAMVDGNYLYVVYVSQPAPPGVWDGKLRIARGLLGGGGQVVFTKWNDGSFSAPGIGGADSAILPAGGCVGTEDMGALHHYDPLGIYLLIFVCRNDGTHQASWYFSTATSLDLQDWSVPQLIAGSQSTLTVPCPVPGNTDGQQFDGWFPSLVSPGAAAGHISQAGYAFYGKGCNTDMRTFNRRTFSINAGSSTPTLDQHGLTGSYYQPATNGQGFEVEVFPDLVTQGTGYLQGSWFTFDVANGGADHNRWYTFAGDVQAGNAATVLGLYQNVGGNFNALPVTNPTQVGHVSIGFSDCNDGLLTYTFTDGTGRIGTVPFIRLTPNVSCAQGGSTAANGDFGLSGNWYDKTTSGQGVVAELNPVAKVLFFAWYTYAVNGQAQEADGQRWFTGLASYTPGARTIALALYETTGGLFNNSTPAPASAQVGTAEFKFTSCAAATLTFSFTGGSNAGQAGTIPLTRVGPTPASCVF
jgi:hypothetical protein